MKPRKAMESKKEDTAIHTMIDSRVPTQINSSLEGESAAPGLHERINIRPEVSILSVLQHLNYKPWYALAEFVDNSLQSFLSNHSDIEQTSGSVVRLRVDIELDTSASGRLIIRDNAAGIAARIFPSAFKPAERPLDRSGLSEFGMGMKCAACWLARHWSVRTKALHESLERTVSFDVSDIVQNKIEEVSIKVRSAPPELHYTEVILDGLHRIPLGRTVTKIKEHLASIYRNYLRNQVLELYWNREPLKFQEATPLTAPYYKTPQAEAVLWRKEIDFDFGQGQRAKGFAALREKASVSNAGFALFRRNRLIEGSGEEGYRPEAIFGKSNSYRYQRLYGELHLDGFAVSHTKDGFRWEEHEELFLEFLEKELNAEPLRLLAQAEEYRVRPSKKSLEAGARNAAIRTAEVIERDVPQILEHEIDAGPDQSAPPEHLVPALSLATERSIDVLLRGKPWRIILELTTDPGISDWVSVSDRAPSHENGTERRCICVRLSLAHPFTDRFGGVDAASIEPLLRLAAAIGLSETAAREAGVQMAGTFRRTINELLREALCNP